MPASSDSSRPLFDGLSPEEQRVWIDELRSLAARLKALSEESRKLFAQIVDLAYSDRTEGRDEDTAYVPEILESTGLDVEHFYWLLGDLEKTGLVSVRNEYPFESVTIESEESGGAARVIHEFCRNHNMSIHEVIPGLRFDLLGMDLRAPEAESPQEISDIDESAFLQKMAEVIRTRRAQRGMTRKMLATQSGVSERFLARVEGGEGNASILVLRQIAWALNVPIHELFIDSQTTSPEFSESCSLLLSLDYTSLRQAYTLLLNKFGGDSEQNRLRRIALIGLRGAGKSTVGAELAKRLAMPFVELGQMIEKASGVPLSGVFDLYGQAGFRRFEQQCLDELLHTQTEFVVATEGGIVSEPATYNRLLASCFTIWLRATPEDHMSRVTQQGDLRPMAQSAEAMSDLKRILEAREHLYRRADVIIQTSGQTVEAVVEGALAALQPVAASQST
jgi:XRE family aerobic/anaerobic benzoate catabolism transcriptional regulator